MADTLDVLTLAEGRVAVGMDGADPSEDTELAQAITAISRRLDDRCGPIVVRTYTDVEMDGNSGDQYATDASSSLISTALKCTHTNASPMRSMNPSASNADTSV